MRQKELENEVRKKMWTLKRQEEDAEGVIEDQIKGLCSQVRNLRRRYWIMWVCFTLTATVCHIQYVRIHLGQRKVIAMDQQLEEAMKENQAAFEKLEAATQELIEAAQEVCDIRQSMDGQRDTGRR